MLVFSLAFIHIVGALDTICSQLLHLSCVSDNASRLLLLDLVLDSRDCSLEAEAVQYGEQTQQPGPRRGVRVGQSGRL